ncbi:TetR/AcrR family transcriptional regulator [uncultured Piscinibacter sp.]|uniref:TetR/AcrR family transcriptional regulator n=1 Tax=uncultured Piscinibacter sp. TaxID=1131835 RepID=UPI002635F46C|nr:TetR family transcriptional regulator [uncultured Piscinibacter sp.]
MPRSSATRPTRRQREPLSRERIARAALALIDAEGLEACTMRRLGASLGVEAMALYHHLPTKGDLLDAVMELLLDEMDMPTRAEAPPLQRVRRVMRSYWEIAVRHPRAFILLAARRFNTDRAFRLYEQLLEAFADAGLDAAGSARWFRLIGGFASGAGMAYAASSEAVADATSLRLEHAPDRIPYPHVRAVAPYLRVQNLDAGFEFGMDRLMAQLTLELHGERR